MRTASIPYPVFFFSYWGIRRINSPAFFFVPGKFCASTLLTRPERMLSWLGVICVYSRGGCLLLHIKYAH